MILVSDLLQDMRASIDADDTTYYRNSRDYFPAINKSVRYFLTLLNKFLSSSRLSDDALRQLSRFTVKDATNGSVLLTDTMDMWALTLVAPNPELDGTGNLVDFSKTAERLSLEQWGKAKDNPFSAGNSVLSGDLTSYGYTQYSVDAGTMIKIRPYTGVTKVALGYIANIEPVNLESDTIPLPTFVYQMILEKALWYLSNKQGDGTSLAQVSDREAQQLTNLLT